MVIVRPQITYICILILFNIILFSLVVDIILHYHSVKYNLPISLYIFYYTYLGGGIGPGTLPAQLWSYLQIVVAPS